MSIQHVALLSDWEEAQSVGAYDRSTLGVSIQQQGYLHACSSPAQVSAVLRLIYADVREPLVLLTLDPDALTGAGLRIVSEPADPADPDGERFPHVYGGPIPLAAVTAVESIERGTSA